MESNKNEIVIGARRTSNIESNALEGELIDSDVVVKPEPRSEELSNDSLLGLFSVFKVGADLKSMIKPSQEYFVKFPAELIKKMKEHDLDFLKDKVTGELLPTLYDYTEKGIGGQIRLELRDSISPKQWNNLGNSVGQAIEQARFDALTYQLNQIQYSVQRIQQGQDTDRFAEVLTGIELLDDAKNSEKESNRLEAAHDAITALKNGINKIKLALLLQLDNIPDVKNSIKSRIWFVISNTENRSNLHSTYNQIQIYFENYYKGLIPLAEAYSLIGEPQRIEALIESTSEILHHPNIQRLNNIEKLLPVGYDYSINWYKNPNRIENKIRDSYSIEFVETEKLFRITGQEILSLKDKEDV